MLCWSIYGKVYKYKLNVIRVLCIAVWLQTKWAIHPCSRSSMWFQNNICFDEEMCVMFRIHKSHVLHSSSPQKHTRERKKTTHQQLKHIHSLVLSANSITAAMEFSEYAKKIDGWRMRTFKPHCDYFIDNPFVRWAARERECESERE